MVYYNRVRLERGERQTNGCGIASYFIEGITQIENTVLMPMNENTPNEFNKRINGGNTNGIFSGFKI